MYSYCVLCFDAKKISVDITHKELIVTKFDKLRFSTYLPKSSIFSSSHRNRKEFSLLKMTYITYNKKQFSDYKKPKRVPLAAENLKALNQSGKATKDQTTGKAKVDDQGKHNIVFSVKTVQKEPRGQKQMSRKVNFTEGQIDETRMDIGRRSSIASYLLAVAYVYEVTNKQYIISNSALVIKQIDIPYFPQYQKKSGASVWNLAVLDNNVTEGFQSSALNRGYSMDTSQSACVIYGIGSIFSLKITQIFKIQ
ncbi:hypothetical protein BDC45DRAFT_537984 [Circinella umbellata]|nr:hypothetical protein BDC45DRAFT_537984 [Circinella umbellata]